MRAIYLVDYTDERCACVWDGNIEKSKQKRTVYVSVARELKEDGLYETIEIKNESEIKETHAITSKNSKGEEEKKWVYTEETEEYLKIKEKTVSDTILYLCDYCKR